MRTPKPVVLSGEGLARVLVATDFSAGSQRAVERAALLPYAEGAEIHLLHVTPAGRETNRARIRSLLDADLRRLRAGLRGSGQSHVAIEVLAVTGSAFEVILRHAERQKSELVVVGRRGYSGQERRSTHGDSGGGRSPRISWSSAPRRGGVSRASCWEASPSMSCEGLPRTS